MGLRLNLGAGPLWASAPLARHMRRLVSTTATRCGRTPAAVVVLIVVAGASAGCASQSPNPPATPVSVTATATVTVSVTPTPTPAKHHHHHAATPTPAPAPVATHTVATPTGCYPISDEGTCYEPGEYCRYDDEGMTGVAGDGEQIECEDNDGWRWEPI